MIWFYRDFLDGALYVVIALLALIFILAIIGFIMERLQLEKEEKNRVAVLQNEMASSVSNLSLESTDLDVVQQSNSMEKEGLVATPETTVENTVIASSDYVPIEEQSLSTQESSLPIPTDVSDGQSSIVQEETIPTVILNPVEVTGEVVPIIEPVTESSIQETPSELVIEENTEVVSPTEKSDLVHEADQSVIAIPTVQETFESNSSNVEDVVTPVVLKENAVADSTPDVEKIEQKVNEEPSTVPSSDEQDIPSVDSTMENFEASVPDEEVDTTNSTSELQANIDHSSIESQKSDKDKLDSTDVDQESDISKSEISVDSVREL